MGGSYAITKVYLMAASAMVSPLSTFPPKPFHLPTPKPLFFIPSKTCVSLHTSTSVSNLFLVIIVKMVNV